MITYKQKQIGDRITVLLDGKIIGHIVTRTDGFQYMPKGSKTGGEILKSVSAVKKSLETEE